MTRAGNGTFYGVGVGPGDPELITLKAARVLAAVDWIYHPLGAKTHSSLARRIVEGLGLPDGKFRSISLGMERERTADLSVYESAARSMSEELERGRAVAWITEGDPMLYSTFMHVHDALRRRCPVLRTEIVPGVSSVQAAAARVGISLAALQESVAIVPAAYGLENLAQLLDMHATVVLLKVNSIFEELRHALARRPEVRAYYVEKVGTPEERCIDNLDELRGQELSYFSLMLLRKEPLSVRT